MKIKMKFRWRIFLLSMGVYVISLWTIGVIITENNYNDSLGKEVRSFLDRETSIVMSASMYIRTNQQLSGNRLNIERYSSRLIDLFRSDSYDLLIYNEQLNLKASTKDYDPLKIEANLEKALQGEKTYQIKWVGRKHYIIITDFIEVEEEKLIMLFIQDISFIDRERIEAYRFFALVGMIGLLVVAVVAGIMTKILMKPIEELKHAAKKIASGHYYERIDPVSRDELGQLAEQFNLMAEEIEKRIEELKEESLRKQRFIDNLVHEVKTPLTSIIGFSDTLIHIKYQPEVFHKGLKYIHSEGNRLLKMINQLMDLILLREDALDCKEEDIQPILEEVRELLKEKSKQKNIAVEIVGRPMKRIVNRDLIKGVIINLVDNSINASREGSSVFMEISSDYEKDCIYIKDEGTGIDPIHLKHILEPYYRADKDRSRKNGGAGLGLSICNEIMKKHGGSIEIESHKGIGTTVKIIFYNFDTNQK